MSAPANAPEVRDNPAAGRFEVTLGGHVAHADYELAPGQITFTHTIVPPEFKGRGIGTALVRAALGAARARGLQVVPLCSFVARYIAEHPEEQDLLVRR